MSRKVDVDNLSADDALYMQDRPWMMTEARLQGVTDIDERIAEALDPDPAPEITPAGEGDEAAVVTNYDALGLPDVRKLAVSRGLPAKGTKKTLIAVLQAADVNDGVTATVSREAEGAVAGVLGTEAPTEPRGDADGGATPASATLDTGDGGQE